MGYERLLSKSLSKEEIAILNGWGKAQKHKFISVPGFYSGNALLILPKEKF